MRLVLSLTLLLFSTSNLLAQFQQPVFGSREDSVRYEELNKAISDMFAGQRDQKKVDSLFRLMNEHLAKVVRYRYVFRPSTDHRPYESIRHTPLDSVFKISLVNHHGKLPDSLFLLRNLRSLELINCRLNKLPRKLGSLNELKTVTIYSNVPSRRFRLAKNETVERLTISGDEFGRLPRRYNKLKNLNSLTLQRNQLAAFPNISGCNSLKRLMLNYNDLTLNDLTAKKRHTSLEELNCGNNDITKLPDGIKAFPNLKRLNLPNNKIAVVEDGIGELTSLEELSFYKNSLTDIPAPVFTLRNLKVIDLYHNQISVVDKRIGGLSNLEILYLANNQIYSLPDNLGQLTQLNELYLHHNRLSSIPAGLEKLSQLRVLRLNQNSILEFDYKITTLKKLKNLDISANQMRFIPLDAMHFPELELISVHTNPWNEDTRKQLEAWAENLRRRNVIVHLTAQKLYDVEQSE